MNKTSSSFVLLAILLISFFAIPGRLLAEPVEAWSRAYDTDGFQGIAFGVAVDRQVNVVVTGYSYNGSNSDYFTIKYDPNGNELWTRTYDGGDSEYARGVAVDRQGNVVVTGVTSHIILTEILTLN
ncbi:MAG: hypothetical protein A3D21_05860 [Nitrospirae bacterium RIFCSPHIGHO2_02_FULL_42_12]|nr:MAG: hypothetical protein A3D21_05860 [Nitrospirae bacterium RIFCSPHIGHO2_02_FULL_42_12]